MTKVRAPLTFGHGLARIAELLGWATIGAITRRSESTARKWGDADVRHCMSIEQALLLDAAYVRAGGAAPPPLLTAYEALLGMAAEEVGRTTTACVERAAIAAKEAGEAIAAQMRAHLPGATDRDRAVARHETEECVLAFSMTLHDLGFAPSFAAGAAS